MVIGGGQNMLAMYNDMLDWIGFIDWEITTIKWIDVELS